jgi:two-component system, OmpR family, sensor kinase
VTNLIDNALKYAPRAEIAVLGRLRGNEVYLSVVDHGPGIPYEHHEHIFDRFTQIERRETRGYGGTGLGLSIVRGLSEAMGGRTWFEPTVGGGATFTVAVPVRAGAVARAEEPFPIDSAPA